MKQIKNNGLPAFLFFFITIIMFLINNTISFILVNPLNIQNNKHTNAYFYNVKLNQYNILTVDCISYVFNQKLLARQIDNTYLQSYYNNAKGSVLKLNYFINHSNNQTYSYDPYGFSLIASGHNLHQNQVLIIQNQFRYNGERSDVNTGLQYLRARFYNPTIKRFTNQDFYNLFNRFYYVNSNPVMNIDPTGNVWEIFRRFFSVSNTANKVTRNIVPYSQNKDIDNLIEDKSQNKKTEHERIFNDKKNWLSDSMQVQEYLKYDQSKKFITYFSKYGVTSDVVAYRIDGRDIETIKKFGGFHMRTDPAKIFVHNSQEMFMFTGGYGAGYITRDIGVSASTNLEFIKALATTNKFIYKFSLQGVVAVYTGNNVSNEINCLSIPLHNIQAVYLVVGIKKTLKNINFNL